MRLRQTRPPDRLKILITQRSLERFGGTELVTAELARALAGRGHSIAVYCPKPGRIAALITPSGIEVCDRLDALPFVPDVIHGHHHLPLMAAMARFPGVPAIHVWHGARPWVEKIPRHPRIFRHVVTSPRMAPRVTAEYGIDPASVQVIANFVDPERFSHVRDVAPAPKNAVLYGQSGFYPHELETLETACRDNGIELHKVGDAYGNPRPRPEYFLPDYDIAFAIGRSALEAMAAGCAVIPIVPQLAGHRVSEASFGAWAEANFSPRYFTSADRFDTAWLRAELAAWDASDIAAVTARVRRDFTLSRALDGLEDLYRAAIAARRPATAEGEFGDYLEWMATEADNMWFEKFETDAELTRLRSQNAGMLFNHARSEHQIRFLMETLLGRLGVAARPDGANPLPSDLHARIAASGLFDADWYLETYPDTAHSGVDPLTHYLKNGAFEGRNPSPGFDGEAYFQANPHLRGMGISPLEHFLRQIELSADIARKDGDGSRG